MGAGDDREGDHAEHTGDDGRRHRRHPAAGELAPGQAHGDEHSIAVGVGRGLPGEHLGDDEQPGERRRQRGDPQRADLHPDGPFDPVVEALLREPLEVERGEEPLEAGQRLVHPVGVDAHHQGAGAVGDVAGVTLVEPGAGRQVGLGGVRDVLEVADDGGDLHVQHGPIERCAAAAGRPTRRPRSWRRCAAGPCRRRAGRTARRRPR